VKWDETTIQEHDKERGTRQKIDEPKTPYHLEHEEALAAFGGAAEKEDVDMLPVEEEKETIEHLKEAEKNKELNAHLAKVA